MRYAINFDKTINQLVPYYLGGRKLILYLQAIIKPLQTINDAFVEYAKEQRIEASVTSQIGYFEWFLNHKFSKYFASSNSKITITNGDTRGVPIFFEEASIDKSKHIKLHKQSEGRVGTVLYRRDDKTDTTSRSFVVNVPAINTAKIKQEVYRSMLTYYIEKYRIANKTYIIKYNK